MNKTRFLMVPALLSAALFLSCSKPAVSEDPGAQDPDPIQPQPVEPVSLRFFAVHEILTQSKTTLVGPVDLHWEAFDKIAVYDGSTQVPGMALTEESGFRREFVTASVNPKAEQYLMVWPWSEDLQTAFSAKQIYTSIASRQVLSEGASVDLRSSVAVSKGGWQDEEFLFKNCFSLLKVSVPKERNGKFTTLSATSVAGEGLSGRMLVDYSGVSPIVTPATGSSSGVELAGAGETLAAGDYYILTAPGTFSQGVVISAVLERGGTTSVTLPAPLVLAPGAVYDCGSFSISDEPVPGPAPAITPPVTGLRYVFPLYATAGTGDQLKYAVGEKVVLPPATNNDFYVDGVLQTQYFVNMYYEPSKSAPVGTLTVKGIGRMTKQMTNALLYSNTMGCDNIPAKSFVGTSYANYVENFYKLKVRLDKPLSTDYSLCFGLYLNGAVRDWELHYSTDDVTYTRAGAIQVQTDKAYQIFSLDVHSAMALPAGTDYWLRLRPTGSTSSAGGSTSGLEKDARLWGGIVITDQAGQNTVQPSGLAFFEPFDRMTGGVDYFCGEKLGHLANQYGAAISSWTADQAGGWTGENVVMRPGYVQISHPSADNDWSVTVDNHRGWLQTPALGVSGTVFLYFKAAAFRSYMYGRTGNKNIADCVNPDAAAIHLTVVGEGKINGESSFQVDELPSDGFETFAVTLSGVNEQTRIRFDSDAEAAFSRWFLDDVCVVKP